MTNQHIGQPVATKYVTFLTKGKLHRIICVEEGPDASCYLWHLPKNSGRKLTYHSDPKRGYEVHIFGAGYHKISESVRFADKFITGYTSSPFCEYHFPNSGIGGELIDVATEDDLIFNLDNKNMDGIKLSFFSDYRSDLYINPYDNGEGQRVKLKTFSLVAATIYQNFRGPIRIHRLSETYTP